MPDDGMLAFDANGNGTIDGADELFGYGTSNSIGTSRTHARRIRMDEY
jgi:hypothetical protein